MQEITVVSGKGGTGKTSFVAAFACLAESCVIADCDVDAANLHLMLSPCKALKREPFFAGYIAEFNQNRCINCGECQKHCRFKAITYKGSWHFEPLFCEGCGVCVDICPPKAVSLHEKKVGEILQFQTSRGKLIQGKLGIAQSTSGKLVTSVRKKAREIAQKSDVKYLFIDGSPGIGCPVIASLTGATAAVIVTEPTVSGNHDLERILMLCQRFDLPAFVIINKYDLNLQQTERIINMSTEMGAKAAGKVKYSKDFYQAVAAGKSIVEYNESESAREIKQVWEFINKNLV